MLGAAPAQVRDQQKDSDALRHGFPKRKAIVAQSAALNVCSQSQTVPWIGLIKCRKLQQWWFFPPESAHRPYRSVNFKERRRMMADSGTLSFIFVRVPTDRPRFSSASPIRKPAWS